MLRMSSTATAAPRATPTCAPTGKSVELASVEDVVDVALAVVVAFVRDKRKVEVAIVLSAVCIGVIEAGVARMRFEDGVCRDLTGLKAGTVCPSGYGSSAVDVMMSTIGYRSGVASDW